VHELAVAESLNYVFQKTTGYATTYEKSLDVPGARNTMGGSLGDIRTQCYTSYGRQVRQRAV
jgi:hypothetical protein